MTRDEQATLLLLRTLLDWAPGPRTSTGAIVAKGALPGEGGSLTDQTCPACHGHGHHRIRGIRRRCERCHATGHVRVDAYTHRELAHHDPLPIQQEIRHHFATLNADPATRGEQRLLERDRGWDVLDRLAQLERVQDGLEAAGDGLTAAIMARDRQYAAGDYQPLERALHRLRTAAPRHHHLLWHAVVCAEPRQLTAADEATVRVGVRILAGWLRLWLGRPVRVPVWLAGQVRQPGRGNGADRRALRRRDEEIRARFNSGEATREELMREYRLSRARFYEVLYATADVSGTAA